MRFDPIVDELEGTTAPAWVVAVREPAYRWSRRLSRGSRHPDLRTDSGALDSGVPDSRVRDSV